MTQEIIELLNQHKLKEAFDYLEKSKKILSKRDYLFYKALISQLNKNNSEASKIYHEILKINKTDIPAIINLSAIYNSEGNHESAHKLLELAPHTNNLNYEIAKFDTNFGLGNYQICTEILKSLNQEQKNSSKLIEREAALNLEFGNTEDAIVQFKKILQNRTESHQTLSNIGVGYLKLEKYEEAEKYAKLALEKDSNNWRYKINLANIYLANNDLDNARLLILDVRDSGIKNYQTETSWARILLFESDYLNAIEVSRSVLSSTSNNAKALTCIADAYSALNEIKLANEYYIKSTETDPKNTLTKWHYCLHLLRNGFFKDGWELYKIGFNRAKEGRGFYASEYEKEWNANVECEKLIVWGEQGIGDQLMFSLFLKYIPQSIRNVEVHVDARLVEVFSNKMYTREGVTFKSLGSQIDGYHIPIGNLPSIFWDEFQKDNQKQNLLNYPSYKGMKIRIGIAWRGGVNERMQRKRSVPLSLFSKINKLNQNNIQIVVLQYNPIDVELEYLKSLFGDKLSLAKYDARIDILSWIDHISSCDLIVSVDNSAIHFAGAIGVPTLTMIPSNPDFRWGLKSHQNFWYSSVELLRDCNIKDINIIAHEIDEWFAKMN